MLDSWLEGGSMVTRMGLWSEDLGYACFIARNFKQQFI